MNAYWPPGSRLHMLRQSCWHASMKISLLCVLLFYTCLPVVSWFWNIVWASDLNWLCFVLHIGHHLWNQKELPVVRVNLGNTSSQYMWNGMQMRSVQCLVLQLLNLPYRGRDQCQTGTVHKLKHVYNNIQLLCYEVVLSWRLYLVLIFGIP